MKYIWVTGLYIANVPTDRSQNSAIWEIVGLYGTKDKAVIACRTIDHFVGRMPFDVDLGDAPLLWPDSYYPLCEARPSKFDQE